MSFKMLWLICGIMSKHKITKKLIPTSMAKVILSALEMPNAFCSDEQRFLKNGSR